MPEKLRFTVIHSESKTFWVLMAQDSAGHWEPVVSVDARDLPVPERSNP